MAERTEEQKLSLAPIEVSLGAKKYEVKVRRILDARAWRKDLVESMGAIVTTMNAKGVSADILVSGLTAVFLAFPEKVADLVFAYDPALPRDVIEAEGTEEELAVAFGAILKVAFPFVSALSMVTQILSSSAIPSPSARPTN